MTLLFHTSAGGVNSASGSAQSSSDPGEAPGPNLKGQAADRIRRRSSRRGVVDLGDAFDGVKLAGQVVAGDLGVVVGLHVDPEHVT